MISPSEKNNEHGHSPSCLDISPERLNRMSPSELADAMEEALDFMTEEDYDSDVISAYLEALDRVSPIPEHPNSEEAYANFKQKLKVMTGTNEAQDQPSVSIHTSKRYRVFRTGLVAALTVILLFGSMIIAQAFGLDVFGAIARWTEEVFSFGELPADETSNNPSATYRGWKTDSKNTEANVPKEYDALKAALDERGLPFRAPVMPEGFEVADSLVYIDPKTNNVEFGIAYTRESDTIKFEVIQFNERPQTVHEKNNGDPEEYEYNGISHYLFGNSSNKVAVWVIDSLEYSLSINSNTVNMKQLIQSIYEV